MPYKPKTLAEKLEKQIREMLETLNYLNNNVSEGERIKGFINENYGQFQRLGKELNSFLIDEMDKNEDPNFPS
jgi:hypothetical protein